jgi:hypothetical protein
MSRSGTCFCKKEHFYYLRACWGLNLVKNSLWNASQYARNDVRIISSEILYIEKPPQLIIEEAFFILLKVGRCIDW